MGLVLPSDWMKFSTRLLKRVQIVIYHGVSMFTAEEGFQEALFQEVIK